MVTPTLVLWTKFSFVATFAQEFLAEERHSGSAALAMFYSDSGEEPNLKSVRPGF